MAEWLKLKHEEKKVKIKIFLIEGKKKS